MLEPYLIDLVLGHEELLEFEELVLFLLLLFGFFWLAGFGCFALDLLFADEYDTLNVLAQKSF